MNANLAFLIFSAGVTGLFFLDRDKSTRTSKALWLPVIWLWIVGSRPVSMWLGVSGPPSGGGLAATLDGSPFDAAFFQALIIAGVIVLARRGNRAKALLKATSPVLIYFLYCLLSTAWSPFPEPSFKRWIKCVGDLVMVLVMVTDPHPGAALHRVISRVGFILFPFSVMLIKCTNLGVVYDVDGPSYTGVTTNKNTFGLILYVVSIGVFWNVCTLLRDKEAYNRTRRLIAQFTLLAFSVVLLQMAHSATSVFCFVLGSGLILISSLKVIQKRPARLHALCAGIFLLGAVGMLSGGGAVTSSMGKTADFSGRTEIWAAALASADSPLIGTGFESFWNKNAHKVANILWYYQSIGNLNSAHDGYLQIYLDLGWIGVCLISIIIISGYARSVKAFRGNPEMGGLFLAYIVTCVFYNISEAGFRILTPSWISLLLAVIGATGVNIGLLRAEERKAFGARVRKLRPTTAIDELLPARHVVRAVERRAKLI
jgi:exopolysaccharide production protein ExoQ